MTNPRTKDRKSKENKSVNTIEETEVSQDTLFETLQNMNLKIKDLD